MVVLVSLIINRMCKNGKLFSRKSGFLYIDEVYGDNR